MHVFGASLDYTPVAALLLSFSLARNKAWRPIRKWLFIAAGITLAALTAFMLTLPYEGKIGPGVLGGLFGRFLLVSYLGWLITVDIRTIKLGKQATAQ
jgi:fucose 4-O-acetylase-like acetyltransferase